MLLEQGVSSLMSENKNTPVETKRAPVDDNRTRLAKENLERKKKRMLDAIGNDAYNGVDLLKEQLRLPHQANLVVDLCLVLTQETLV